MPSHSRGARSPTKRQPPPSWGTRPQSTGPPVARTATPPIPPAPNIETTTAIGGEINPSGSTMEATFETTTTIGGESNPLDGDNNNNFYGNDPTPDPTTPLAGEIKD